jgi:hypothetical protein
MKFTVIWSAEALAELADLWLDNENRLAINQASNELDQLLHDDPLLPRFELVNGIGIAVRPPLGVDFRVSIPDRAVLIFAVWLASEEGE